MIRTTFYQPEGELTPSLVLDVLELVCTDAPRIGEIVKWTSLERLVAYDWAIREHMVAGDNTHIRRRPRPSFTVRTLESKMLEGIGIEIDPPEVR